ncbi:hypothetical protein LZ575_05465 [Antarcticibacterium sp. 1MA-6-2]|uniref:hypothetical protein n=1 Tax=Antarcticibacterium sp. 1MA-6-2 TaxID=2908210 RepID=UPI001F46E1D9|nr:hypothetical protein [Antarcticibacterium sp. 1MA-6-2]UJH92054.1 hypothetical protein LZ575_05465 [Antarcticibacterium sp. 1MA-6-2]
MRTLLYIFCLLILPAGCAAVQPALSISNSENLETFAVKGRQGILINQELEFGEFETSKVKRSWTKGGNSRLQVPVGDAGTTGYPDLPSLNYIDRNQTFHFQMKDSTGQESDVYAASEFSSEDLQLEERSSVLEEILGFSLKSENFFYLQIFLNKNLQPWQLILDNEAAQVFPGKYRGILVLDENTYYSLEPISKVQGKKGPKSLLLGSIGYEIFNSRNHSIAAVSLVDNGKVYFNTNDPEERFLLANLCAALLLQENISEE